MADYTVHLQHRRIEERRAGMERLHAEMLEERDAKVYSTEETVELINDLRVP